MPSTNDARQNFTKEFVRLGIESQILLLVKLADKLTLLARDTYGRGGEVSDSKRLRAFNEALHRILGQLDCLLTANEQRYPDDVFANILLDQFSILKIDPNELVGSATRRLD